MNNRGLTNLFIFAAGAVAGSLVTWFAVKEYYKRIADEEIESVKEVFSRSYDEPNNEDLSDVEECYPDDLKVITTNTTKKPDLMEYAAIIKEQGYINYADGAKPGTTTEEVTDVQKPYVIDPAVFGEEYETETLTYYADGVLADDHDEPIDDVDDVVGKDSLNRFGEYERDSVFVRNDKLKTDFEILRDYDKFIDVVGED